MDALKEQLIKEQEELELLIGEEGYDIKECPTCKTLKKSEPTPEGDEVCENCGSKEMLDVEPRTPYLDKLADRKGLNIKIIVEKNGEIIGKKTALSFESAEENLGKLERALKANQELI